MLQRFVSYTFGSLGSVCFVAMLTPPHGLTDLTFGAIAIATFIIGVVQKMVIPSPPTTSPPPTR
jgi:hypothetical protein